MKCAEIYSKLDGQIHFSDQMDWDNSGLIIGRRDKEVGSVLVALDLAGTAADIAAEGDYDLIVTHHPVLWEPIKRITDETPAGRKLLSLAARDTACIVCHTCYDAAHGGMGDICGDMLGIEGTPLVITGERDGQPIGIGRTGRLGRLMNAEELAREVKAAFALDYVTVYGSRLLDKGTDRAAVCPGSGRGEYRGALESGAEVLITGDITHHEALDAVDAGICVIDAGHFGLEKVFIRDMAKRLAAICGEEVRVDYTYEGYDGRII